MAIANNPLTEAQINKLQRARATLDDVRMMIKAAQACEIDCTDWADLADTLHRKITLLLNTFAPDV